MSSTNDKLREKLLRQKELGLFCDLDLLADDGTRFRVHASVVHAASEYFEQTLTADVRKIEMNGISGQILTQLIEYFYAFEIDIDESNVKAIMNAAHRYRLDDLKARCTKFCAEHLGIASAVDYFDLANKYDLVDLRQSAQMFIGNAIMFLVDDPSFFRLSVEVLAECLKNDEFMVESETDVFEAVAKWIDHDLEGRRPHINALMKTVRMSKIGYEFIIGRMRECLVRWNETNIFAKLCEEKFKQGQHLTESERCIAGNHVYIIGQAPRTSNLHIYRYTPATDAWYAVTIIRDGQLCPRIHRMGNFLYTVSGSINKEVKVHRTDCRTSETTIEKSASFARILFTSVVLGDDIYVLGGFNHTDTLNIVERFSTKNGEWTEMACLQAKRRDFDAVSLAGKVYAVGGFDDNALSSVECYDPDINEWHFVANLNVNRAGHCCGVVNGSIYAVGGYKRVTIEKYDAQIDKWTIISCELEVPRHSFGMIITDGFIYLIAGEFGGGKDVEDTLKINIANGENAKLSKIPLYLSDVCCSD